MSQTHPIRVPLPMEIFAGQVAIQEQDHRLSDISVPVYSGVTLTTSPDNPGLVFVNAQYCVNAIEGYPLVPFQSIYLEVKDLYHIRLVADSPDNVLFYIGS